jgi:hypothetical protein
LNGSAGDSFAVVFGLLLEDIGRGFSAVIAGLDPAIHLSSQKDGCADHVRA